MVTACLFCFFCSQSRARDRQNQRRAIDGKHSPAGSLGIVHPEVGPRGVHVGDGALGIQGRRLPEIVQTLSEVSHAYQNLKEIEGEGEGFLVVVVVVAIPTIGTTRTPSAMTLKNCSDVHSPQNKSVRNTFGTKHLLLSCSLIRCMAGASKQGFRSLETQKSCSAKRKEQRKDKQMSQRQQLRRRSRLSFSRQPAQSATITCYNE